MKKPPVKGGIHRIILSQPMSCRMLCFSEGVDFGF